MLELIYVQYFHAGDWYGGKGVGLCKLLIHGHPVNVYIAHVSIPSMFSKHLVCIQHNSLLIEFFFLPKCSIKAPCRI